MSSITIKKSTDGLSLRIVIGANNKPYPANSIYLSPEADGSGAIYAVLKNVYTDAEIFRGLPANIFNGDTTTAFADYASVEAYVTANFFRKAGGIASFGTITGSPTDNSALALALKQSILVPTAVKTGTYTAVANDFVPVDTTAGNVAVTLPNAPADRTMVGIKHIIQGGINTVTLITAGTDVFNKAGGGASITLSLPNQGMLLQYQLSTKVWFVLADDLPLGGLDARYGYTAGSKAMRFKSVATYALMVADGTPAIPTYYEVIADENKSYTRSTYLWKDSGRREWVASTPDN